MQFCGQIHHLVDWYLELAQKPQIIHVVDREKWEMYEEHVGRQTNPIAEVFDYYRVPEDMAICLNLDAYLRFRPVYGDGECFYRSFIFSYLEQVLDRQDTHEEHRLLDTINRVSTQHTNLGWTSSGFRRSYKAFKKLIKKVMGWKRQGRWNSIASPNSYRKEKLLAFFSTYNKTEDIFVFLRLVVAIQICSHAEEYGQLITGLSQHYTLKDWCFLYVTPAREFTDHIMMTALARALEVPLRLERLHGVGSDEDNIYTGPGDVSVTLLYTGNHYDVIYPRPVLVEHPAD
ncbi:OVARIAN TUMOR DOMAIN-containing deubiquitinating enzyme 1-like [Lolium rigidum]|uniref:OVARIAN TUMOR DOMAIN-containing deubiquitinating enzyme 1-like n=1 Tax=Lolium rigidum TaxID=89674 RepID=UPI001F5D38C3|nr:OVARIAN TUMOR DOMAIN-containing deubiquitinating enzyme 1-like [Lolium rigidum]